MPGIPNPRPTPGRVVLYTPADQTPRKLSDAKEWAALVGHVSEGAQGIVCHLLVFEPFEAPRWIAAVPYDENRGQPAGSWRYPPRVERAD